MTYLPDIGIDHEHKGHWCSQVCLEEGRSVGASTDRPNRDVELSNEDENVEEQADPRPPDTKRSPER
jgi:hypothetical protein